MERPAAFLYLIACVSCSPQDVLSRQGSTLKNTDFVQVAVDQKKESDRKAQTEEEKRRAAQDVIDKHANAGAARMDLGEYDAALKEYKDAYVLSNDPKFLPIIAGATRKTGDCSAAKSLYKEYLVKVPSSPDRVTIEAKVRETETCEKNLGNNFDKVREYYQKGVTHYELSEYNEAAGAFKEAYRLSKDPTYLFNIGQAYRQGKNCGEAGKFYSRYLSAVPDADNREKVDGYVEDMKRCAR
jgi:tetratricopeptide (TPR) repeat protein